MDKQELDLYKQIMGLNQDLSQLFDLVVGKYPNLTEKEFEVLDSIIQKSSGKEYESFCFALDSSAVIDTFDCLRAHPNMKISVCSSYQDVVAIIPDVLAQIIGDNPEKEKIFFGKKEDIEVLSLDQQVVYFTRYFHCYGNTYEYRDNLDFIICAPLFLKPGQDENLYVVLTK